MAAYTTLIDPEVLYSFILFPANIQGGYPFIFLLGLLSIKKIIAFVVNFDHLIIN